MLFPYQIGINRIINTKNKHENNRNATKKRMAVKTTRVTRGCLGPSSCKCIAQLARVCLWVCVCVRYVVHRQHPELLNNLRWKYSYSWDVYRPTKAKRTQISMEFRAFVIIFLRSSAWERVYKINRSERHWQNRSVFRLSALCGRTLTCGYQLHILLLKWHILQNIYYRFWREWRRSEQDMSQ